MGSFWIPLCPAQPPPLQNSCQVRKHSGTCRAPQGLSGLASGRAPGGGSALPMASEPRPPSHVGERTSRTDRQEILPHSRSPRPGAAGPPTRLGPCVPRGWGRARQGGLWLAARSRALAGHVNLRNGAAGPPPGPTYPWACPPRFRPTVARVSPGKSLRVAADPWDKGETPSLVSASADPCCSRDCKLKKWPS